MKKIIAGMFMAAGILLFAHSAFAQVTVNNNHPTCEFRVVVFWDMDGFPSCSPDQVTVTNVPRGTTANISPPVAGYRDVKVRVILWDAPAPRPFVEIDSDDCGGSGSESLGNLGCGTNTITYSDHTVTVVP